MEGQIGGYASLRKLDDLSWQQLEDTTTEFMWLDPNETDLLLARNEDITRLVHPVRPIEGDGLLSAIDLADPAESFPRWIELGFPHPSLWNTPALEAQREVLAAKPRKERLIVGARVWPKKSKTTDMAHSERGEIITLAAGNNGKKYAEAAWDSGCTTWIRTGLLVALGDDAFESATRTAVTAEAHSSLSCWLHSNSSGQCFVSGAEGTRCYQVNAASWWLAKVFEATPLEELVSQVAAWTEARDLSDEYLSEEIGSPVYTLESCNLTGSFPVARAARAIKDALILRWLREPTGVPAPAGLIALRAQMPSDESQGEDLGACLAQSGPHAAADREPLEDDAKRGADLGLNGPVAYCHD